MINSTSIVVVFVNAIFFIQNLFLTFSKTSFNKFQKISVSKTSQTLGAVMRVNNI